MKIIKRVFDLKGAPALAAAFAILFIAEARFPLRRRVQQRWKRTIINSAVSIPAFSLLRFLLLPILVKLAAINKRLKFGLNYCYQSPPIIKGTVAFLFLDYTNYFWHVLLHKLPLLWRFHFVHHSDRDLDVTTALRFHFGELIGSVIYRGAFVFLSGTSPLNVLLYEIAFEGATQFHHSNLELPYQLENHLNKVLVTPRMHGIHHSVIADERDSNYSVILSFWDRLHNTIRSNVQQGKIVIGVPNFSDPEELTIGFLLKMPFTKIHNNGG